MSTFLCDEMLSGLGKWLRAAGYDTLIAQTGASDQELLDLAVQQNRILLTRDSHFLERKTSFNGVIYLNSNSLDECIEELTKKAKINWLYRPFSRCLKCNSLLVEADTKEKEQIPEDIRSAHLEIWFCRECKKTFWQGSHTSQMLKQLELWQKRINLES